MRILGFAGPKNSGKNTLSNFLHGYQMRANELIDDFTIDSEGKLYVQYSGENNSKQTGLLDVQRSDANFALWATRGMWPYVKNYAFGDALKEICIGMFEVPRKLAYGSDEDKNTIVPHLLWENMPGVYTDEKMYKLTVEANPDISKILIYHKAGSMTIREFLQYVGTDLFRRMWYPVWTNHLMKQIKDEESALSIITDVRFDNEATDIINNGGKVIRLTKKKSDDKHDSEAGISDNLVSNVLDNTSQDLAETCQNLLNIVGSYGWQ